MDNFQMTAAASCRIATINQQNQEQKALRIAVQGGGCAGFQYTFLMDATVLVDDHVFESNADNGLMARVVIDEVSLSFLKGCILDYQDDLAASMFVIKNPQATGGCGCGNSFSL